MAEVVGLRLQAIRKFYGWSQRELAKRAGVPNSAISVIEHGSVSPSVASLEKVLKGFPMTMSDFFSISIAESHCKVVPSSLTLKEGVLFSLNAKFQDISSKMDEGRQLEFYTALKGEQLPNHFLHSNSLMLVTDGDVLLHSLDFDQELSMGDSVSLYAPIPYRLSVLSDKASWVLAGA
jgi:transcriptional regulator with XRE-family HTH domain